MYDLRKLVDLRNRNMSHLDLFADVDPDVQLMRKAIAHRCGGKRTLFSTILWSDDAQRFVVCVAINESMQSGTATMWMTRSELVSRANEWLKKRPLLQRRPIRKLGTIGRITI
jgi:hypothetical protein